MDGRAAALFLFVAPALVLLPLELAPPVGAMLPAGGFTTPEASPRRPLDENSPPLLARGSPAAQQALPTPAGSAFLLDVVAELRRENERLHAEMAAQRCVHSRLCACRFAALAGPDRSSARACVPRARSAHSESLARSLASRRTQKSPGVQKRVLSELVRLRREVLTSASAIKELKHETTMTRTAFRVRLAAT